MEFNFKELNQDMELAAIWLQAKPFITRDGKRMRSVRLTKGDLINVIDGELVSCAIAEPTHKIIGCYGTICSSKLRFMAINLKTNEPEMIRV